MKAFKYRLYPTKDQMSKLEWTVSRCCELYNAALQERKDTWNSCKKHHNFHDTEWRAENKRYYSISFAEQCRSLTEIRNEIRQEYKQIGSHVLQNVLHRVEDAFSGFFRRVLRGQTPGYPRYLSHKRYDSFCFPDHAGWKLTGNRLSISNLGTIKVKLHYYESSRIFKQRCDRLRLFLSGHFAASGSPFLHRVMCIRWPDGPADTHHTSFSGERRRREASGQKWFCELLKKFGMTYKFN